MEGQVFVPYTGIGGFSMSNETMSLNVTGSSGEGVPPEFAMGYVSISWIYPGGIMGKTYGGSGLWGYLLSPQSEGGAVTTDVELTA